MSDREHSIRQRLAGVTSFSASPSDDLKGSTKQPSKSKGPILSNYGTLVTLYVGGGSEKHIVHKDFACHYSPVLNAAFNSQFVEGQNQEYRLQDTPRKVDLFYQFESSQQEHPAEKHTETENMYDLWILADKLLSPSLQNLVLRKLDEAVEATGIIHSSLTCHLWEHTACGSLLRKWLIIQYAMMPGEDYRKWIDQSERYPYEMVNELMAYIREKTEKTKDDDGYEVIDWSCDIDSLMVPEK